LKFVCCRQPVGFGPGAASTPLLHICIVVIIAVHRRHHRLSSTINTIATSTQPCFFSKIHIDYCRTKKRNVRDAVNTRRFTG
jgi:hypothetical protein